MSVLVQNVVTNDGETTCGPWSACNINKRRYQFLPPIKLLHFTEQHHGSIFAKIEMQYSGSSRISSCRKLLTSKYGECCHGSIISQHTFEIGLKMKTIQGILLGDDQIPIRQTNFILL